ncbi:MAG: hypothetical protein IJY27_06785 [Clostridia bacterium]|nr:hypothetical protein [Clostridia bacterium]
MYLELIPEAGRFYKVNMHCHSTISDGKQTPEEIKEYFKSRGYSAVCYTDHEVLIPHKELCDDEFIALHGFEIAVKKDEKGHTAFLMPVYHFNLIAKSQDQVMMPHYYRDNPSCAGNARQWINEHGVWDDNDIIDHTEYDIDWINEHLDAISRGGFLITYNHPQWSLQNLNDYAGLRHIHAIELINGGCIRLNDNTALHYEQYLRAGGRAVPVGGDDNHNTATSLLAWTMIKAPELTYDALISAYERGECYASDGPEIHSLVLRDGKIVVKTSPAALITLMSEGRHTQWKRDPAGERLFTEAEFSYDPEKFGKYFRIEVRDAKGYHAYSNAYFTDDIEEKIK